MNFPWAIWIAREDAEALAPLRLAKVIEVAEEGPRLWLRGQRGDEQLAAMLAGLPARERYEWLPTNQLRPIDRRIPERNLPNFQWLPLSSWLQVEAPAAALPATPPTPAPVRLVRSSYEREPELLITSLQELEQFAATAAQVRLERLQFAANQEGFALVRGRPLPPLPGRRFVLHSGLGVPTGFGWEPAVGSDVLVRRFGIAADALVIWHEDGAFTRLHAEQFVPLSRSALRATRKTMAESQ